MSDRSCAAVILAAGDSSRLGHAKQLVKIGGETLLRRTARIAREVGCCPIVTVLGFEADRMCSELVGLDALAVLNESWRSGMGSSMRRGVAAALDVDPDLKNVVLLVCDQVRLTADVLRQILFVHSSLNHPITAARYGGKLGVPVVFSSTFFLDLLVVNGDQGARLILEGNAKAVAPVDFPGGEFDVDTPDDLERNIGFRVVLK